MSSTFCAISSFRGNMEKHSRENRVPIMFSDEEITAIDDWGFSNRIRTRAEAIRRLCQMGIIFDREILPRSSKVLEVVGTDEAGGQQTDAEEDFDSFLSILLAGYINAYTYGGELPQDIKLDTVLERLKALNAVSPGRVSSGRKR